MTPQTTDRRVRRTKKLLLQGLTQLMSQKKINKITVKELTELVDVNRATFYLYYKDIFDMVDQIENDIFEHFSEALKKFTDNGLTKDNSLSFFIFIFEYVKEYADMCKILLGPEGDYAFVEKLKSIIKSTLPPPLNSESTKIQSQYFMPFIISGCTGTIQQWLESGMTPDPESMAEFVVELIVNSSGISL